MFPAASFLPSVRQTWYLEFLFDAMVVRDETIYGEVDGMRLGMGVLGFVGVLALVVASAADQPDGPAFPPDSGAGPEVSGDRPYRVAGRSPIQKNASSAPESGVQTASAGQLIGFSGFDGSGSQTITLVHAGKMQIAVYHIDRSGQIRLVSSRPIDADFSVTLNPTAPHPDQLRLLSKQAK